MIDYNVETRTIYEIQVPHSIYKPLFTYKVDYENWERKNTHYGMYYLTRVKEEIENLEYDLEQEEIDFFNEVYNFCEEKFNEVVAFSGKGIEIRFLDSDF